MKTSPILNLISQSGSLMTMKRTHHRSLGTTFDTVASHSFHVAIIAYCIARMEKLTHEEALQAMAMGMLHDLAEARTGDLDFIAKRYVQVNEQQAINEQFDSLEFGEDLKNIQEEYEKRQTKLSQCVKDADSLEQMYQQWILSWQGNKLADKWLEKDLQKRKFYTDSAKTLMQEMLKSTPHDWWWQSSAENYQTQIIDKQIPKNENK